MAKLDPKITTNHRRHLAVNYFLLFFIFLTGGITLVFIDEALIQHVILLSLAGIYIIWGLWHHHEHRTLNKDVVLEYMGVAGIIILIYLLAT